MGAEAEVKAKRYTPPNCSRCTQTRADAGYAPNVSFVIVTHTFRQTGYIFRYCKCKFCNNTFKDSEVIR